jgi:hypothetical protein
MALHLPMQGVVGKGKLHLLNLRLSEKRVTIDDVLLPAWQAAIVSANKAPIQGLQLKKFHLCTTAKQQHDLLSDLVRVLKNESSHKRQTSGFARKEKWEGEDPGIVTSKSESSADLMDALAESSQEEQFSGVAQVLMLLLAVQDSAALHQQALYSLRLLPTGSVLKALPIFIKALISINPHEAGQALLSMARICGDSVRRKLAHAALPLLCDKLCAGIESIEPAFYSSEPNTGIYCIQAVVSLLEGTIGPEDVKLIHEHGPAIISSLAFVLANDAASHEAHISAALALCMVINHACEDADVRVRTLLAVVSNFSACRCCRVIIVTVDVTVCLFV